MSRREEERIYDANDPFDVNQLKLTAPTILSGGHHFMKYVIRDHPLYLQTGKCTTKQGIIKAGKRMYCDLVFTNEHESFIRWLENLEEYSQKYIYDHRSQWFETELEMHDIENSFTSPLKLYKSGKYYLLRVNIPVRLGKCTLRVYDEDESVVDLESIRDTTQMYTILELQGIRCSARSFQIEIEMKQMMVLRPNDLFETCVISKGGEPRISSTSSSSTMSVDDTVRIHPGIKEEETPMTDVLDKERKIRTGLPGRIPQHIQEEYETDHKETESDIVPSIEGESCDTMTIFDPRIADSRTAEKDDDERLGGSVNGTKGTEEAKASQGTDPGDTRNVSEEEVPKGDVSEDLEENIIDIERKIRTGFAREDSEAIAPEGGCPSTYSVGLPEEYASVEPVLNTDTSIEDFPEEYDLDHTMLDDKDPPVYVRRRNDVYYDMYLAAKTKAQAARDLAIQSFLEAKRIQNLYHIQDPDSDRNTLV